MSEKSAFFGLTSNVFQMSSIVFLLLFDCLLQSTCLGEFREEQKRKELVAIANDEVGNINSRAMKRGEGGGHCMQHHNIFSRHRVAYYAMHRPLNHTILYAVANTSQLLAR